MKVSGIIMDNLGADDVVRLMTEDDTIHAVAVEQGTERQKFFGLSRLGGNFFKVVFTKIGENMEVGVIRPESGARLFVVRDGLGDYEKLDGAEYIHSAEMAGMVRSAIPVA